MLKWTLNSFILTLIFSCLNAKRIDIAMEIKKTETIPFIEHVIDNDSKSYGNALAMNISNLPILLLRKEIEAKLNIKLKYFKGWNEEGESHVTVITPPEFVNHLSEFISMKEINLIAKKNKIQSSDIRILGIGSGKHNEGHEGNDDNETFFLIVDSINLRTIRFEIFNLFVRRGGDPKEFDPSWFFPHITIGFISKDIHEPNIMKDIKNSYDSRFDKLSKSLID